MSSCRQLKELIDVNKEISLIMESHNGLSAKIAESSGFPAIWASGFSIASSFGLRDCNEGSWSQVLDVVEFMVDATDIPILFDGDSGFGNFNNVRHIVKKLSNLGVAGICLEDKLFPKMNSFIGEGQLLSDSREVVGKIKAARDSALDPDFVVIARTEALISGLGVNEAIERAHQYIDAGADAIFIHSKASDASEVLDFSKKWRQRTPLVVAPTTFNKVPVETLEQAGVSLYICANQMMRASLKAMERVSRQIFENRSLSGVDDDVASVKDVFNLLNYKELEVAEKKYLPSDF